MFKEGKHTQRQLHGIRALEKYKVEGTNKVYRQVKISK